MSWPEAAVDIVGSISVCVFLTSIVWAITLSNIKK